jgi:2-desacetyl-2-hydroxyethyl bacteriochlorophyllide A dehydrogenase
MYAAVINKYNSIDWQEVQAPKPSKSDVLIKITYATICGTDQHIFSGEFHPRTRLPLIPGHEFTGVVEKTGKDVMNIRPGEKVVVDPIIWCGICDACKAGHYPACSSLKVIGVDLNGGFAEYISVPESMIYKVPDKVPDTHAALVEILSIGFHACNRAGLKENETVAIWGAGKVGNAILQAARTITDDKIFFVDILEKRLTKAVKAYPDIYTINAMTEDPVQVIKEVTSGKGVDVAFEAVGHAYLPGDMVHPVRGCVQSIKGGGRVCVLGLADDPAPVLIKELIWKEAKIISSRVSQGEFSKVIDELSKGRLKPESMITAVIHPSETQKAFELLISNPEEHLKILLKFY